MPALAPILRAENHERARIVVPSAIPAAVPVFIAPIAAAPAPKHRSVEHAAVGKLKHPFLPVWTTRKNPQGLRMSLIRICIHRVVADPKRPVLTRQKLQPLSNVHMIALAAILRV